MLLMPTSRAKKRLDIPHEPGQWIEIQRLAWSELPQRSVVSDVTGYMVELFRAAITAWSYAEPVADNVAYLDDTTAGWLYQEIDKFIHQHEADQGNATAPSTLYSTET